MNDELIDFSYSIGDWLAAFQRLFDILSDFFKEAFNIDLFRPDDSGDGADEG